MTKLEEFLQKDKLPVTFGKNKELWCMSQDFWIEKSKEIIRKQANCIDWYADKEHYQAEPLVLVAMPGGGFKGKLPVAYLNYRQHARQCQRDVEEILK